MGESLFVAEKSTIEELVEYFVGYFVGLWYCLYELYKILINVRDIKYTISLTRNASRLTGYLCSLTLPRFMRYGIYGLYCNIYKIDLSEVED